MNIKEKVLRFLETDCRYSAKNIADAIDVTEQEVADVIAGCIDDGTILGYKALINWDKTEREFVTALIEVKVTPQRGNGFDKIAERIYSLEEVKAVYLMSGGFDLTVIIEAKSLKDIAFFVSDKLSPINAVTSTATHFVLKKYKDHGIILENEEEEFKRMEFPDLV